MTTRDGTSLAVDVRLPGPADKGPYPTLVEYSGYGYANPAGAESGISQIMNLLGYAVVDVNMRGTGCSGGAFDYFERLQSLDGYDVVETAARQPWVLHNRVGMVGVSYGGISQLFVGATSAAAPGRDHPAVGDRQHRHHALPGRPAQHRLRRAVGAGPGRRLEAGLADRGPGLGLQADPGRGSDLQGQPDPAHRSRGPDRQDLQEPLLPAESREPTVSRDLRQQHQGARLHGLSVQRRADRRPLSQPRRPVHRRRAASGSPSPTASTSIPSIPRPSTAGSTSWSCTSPSENRSTHRGRRPRRRGSTRPRWASRV